MPGAPAMFTDLWAPAQYVPGSTGASGPLRSPQDDSGGFAVNSQDASTYNANLPYHVAGVIVLALVTVFVLQQLGFRFVVAAGVGRS